MKRLVSLMLLFCLLACVPTPDVDGTVIDPWKGY